MKKLRQKRRFGLIVGWILARGAYLTEICGICINFGLFLRHYDCERNRKHYLIISNAIIWLLGLKSLYKAYNISRHIDALSK